MGPAQFGNLTFEADLSAAWRGDERLRFTRQERALLKALVNRPGQLFTRDQLLDAVTHVGSATSDRNIDYVISRLRAKLGDNSRTPRFIATRYGEGYVWIARPGGAAEDVFLVVGPCYGLGHAPTAALADDVLNVLTAALGEIFGPAKTVKAAPNWRGGNEISCMFALEATLHGEAGRLHAAFLLRETASRRILMTRRAVVGGGADAGLGALADDIRDAIWKHLAAPGGPRVQPVDVPFEIRVHDAARIFSGSAESYAEIEKQVALSRARNPDDPLLPLMAAFGLYARMIQPAAFPSDEEWAAAEAEIERLVFDSLPRVQDEPAALLGAAKLLCFTGRGHLEFAERLADDALAAGPAFPAYYATRAQLLMWRGETDNSLALFDKAIELAEPESEFLVYVLVLKAGAHMAAGQRAEVRKTVEQVCKLRPPARMRIGFFFVDPDEPVLDPALEAGLGGMTLAVAQGAIRQLYRISARHFVKPQHRDNIMRGLVTHLVRKLGPDAVPAEFARLSNLPMFAAAE
jgi:tetratricopeptide (TPR) repeat protein